eukprot:729010-Alexandrium_andersonii.AAC.1
MSASLVGSEMCIRDRPLAIPAFGRAWGSAPPALRAFVARAWMTIRAIAPAANPRTCVLLLSSRVRVLP